MRLMDIVICRTGGKKQEQEVDHSCMNNVCVCVSGRVVSGECQGEMMDYRRMLMEDFSLSPEIVLHCRGEIESHCSGLHRKGRTLHCLMRVGRGDMGAIDLMCQRAVSYHSLTANNGPLVTNQKGSVIFRDKCCVGILT